MKHLVFDASNLLYRTFFIHLQESPEDINALCYNTTLITMFSIWKKERPDKTFLAFDRPNWRVDYTKSDKCYSKRLYKGTRAEKRDPKIDALHPQFKAFINEIEQMFRDYTQIKCLSADLLEADDLISGVVQKAVTNNDTVTVVSTDKDYIQLLKFNTEDKTLVNIYDPFKKQYHQVEDPAFYLFEKCFRGDHSTDNIQSAYPRLRMDKIKTAYNDDYVFNNLINHVWTHPVDGREMSVKKLFNENIILTDLTAQPKHIRQLIIDTIEQEMVREQKYNHFRMLKFLGKYQLKRLAEQIEMYLPMIAQ